LHATEIHVLPLSQTYDNSKLYFPLLILCHDSGRRLTMSSNPQQTEFAARAERVYEARWKSTLETEHLDKLIALDPDSGDYVLGKTLRDLDIARRQKFGTKPVHIFRVGGGAAVKIGGAIRHARVSG
jgi:hypothetical protein